MRSSLCLPVLARTSFRPCDSLLKTSLTCGNENCCGSSLCFFVNSNQAVLFLLLISGLYLVVWLDIFFSYQNLQIVDCDTFTSALWRLLEMSLTAAFCHQSLLISSVNLFVVKLLEHQWFVYFSGHSRLLYWLYQCLSNDRFSCVLGFMMACFSLTDSSLSYMLVCPF